MIYILSKPLGNNIFSYSQRESLWSDCSLVISNTIEISSLDQVQLGDFVVFEEIDHLDKLCSNTWLAHTYILTPEHKRRAEITSLRKSSAIIITDNHNHILPHRLEFISQSDIPKAQLIHIDQHSDLWPNSNTLNTSQIHKPQYRRNFAHLECNIGNFITPCVDSWLITHMTQVRTEYTLNELANHPTSSEFISWNQTTILDIDLDFRAPEMWITNIERSMSQVRSLMDHADLITIASSPYFIDQKLALDLLHQLLWPRLAKHSRNDTV